MATIDHTCTETALAPLSSTDCAVVELRRYELERGRRDELITLFDREFVESQEDCGMALLGQFRDLDRPQRYTWLRGFADMGSRLRALQSFYGGPVWQQHRDAANATMRDVGNVFLLRPAWDCAGLTTRPALRAPVDAPASPRERGLVDLTVFPLRSPADAALLDFCRSSVVPLLHEGVARQQGWYVSEAATNDFPRLPVRESEPVLVGLALFDDAAAFDRFAASGAWTRHVQPRLAAWLSGAPDAQRLAPTARSALQAGVAR